MTGAEVVFVDSWDETQQFMRWLGERRPILAFDLETTGLDPYRDKIRLAQFGDANTGWALPFEDWRGVVREVLEKYDRPMVAHNAKFDVSHLEVNGLSVPRHLIHDTMTMCHLVDSHGPKGLKRAAKLYVGQGADRAERSLDAAMKAARWTWATVPVDFEPYWFYGGIDTVLTARLAENLWKRVQPYRDAYELEIAVTWALLNMEQRGAKIDVEYCLAWRNALVQELDEIRGRYLPDLNILSSTQVVDALLEAGVELTKKTENGNLALDDAVLARIDHPIARDARRARYCDKMASTYFDAYLRFEVDGIVHCNVNPLGAARTGRMSISRPSMQNIPRKALVRNAIVAREKHKLILTDYQAQETRLIAHFANETGMIEAFKRGDDIHTFVASMVYSHPIEAVTKEQRRRAKACGHARNYGATVPKLAATAGITMDESRAFVARYDAEFPKISRFNTSVVNAVRERDAGDGYGHVFSYSGRKIRVPVEKAYTGVNYLIQGSGSDALKKGLVNADRAGIGEFALLPVHDEVVWDVPEDLVEDVLPEIHAAFEHEDLRVPLPIEEKVVERWGDAYE